MFILYVDTLAERSAMLRRRLCVVDSSRRRGEELTAVVAGAGMLGKKFFLLTNLPAAQAGLKATLKQFSFTRMDRKCVCETELRTTYSTTDKHIVCCGVFMGFVGNKNIE